MRHRELPRFTGTRISLARYQVTCLLLAGPALASGPEAPFPTANRSPLLLPVGLPDAGSAVVLPAGALALRSTLEVANTSLYEPSLCGEGCSLALDGETTRLAIGARRGFGDGWEASVTLPLLRHGGGFLDSVIEGWHAAFGLPNGDRDRFPQDRLRYRYRPDSGGVAITDEHDIGLFFKRVRVLQGLFGDVDHHAARFQSIDGFEGEARN